MRLLLPALAIATIAIFALTSCGTYRGAGSGYRSGNGGWRTSSDYAQDPETRDFYLNENRSAPQYIPSAEFRLYWPVNPVKINRGFRPSTDRDHDGIDLGGPANTPILAAHEGVVIYAGRDFRGYGNMVMIEYSPEWATLYGHLNEVFAREGQAVKPGEPIGGMGKTGKASGVHLHFELLHQKSPVDPLPVLSRGSKFARSR
jgi:murein DD-endopeptidase MepM/ murein hydrolase activator NlpD